MFTTQRFGFEFCILLSFSLSGFLIEVLGSIFGDNKFLFCVPTTYVVAEKAKT